MMAMMMMHPVRTSCTQEGICRMVSPLAMTPRIAAPTNVPHTLGTPSSLTVRPRKTVAYALRK
jgi:hypothetical protein